MADVPQGRMGFYDSKHNIFYEIESPEEYQHCLQHYQKQLALQHPQEQFSDFDSLVEELDQKDNQTEPNLEMYEF